MLQVSNLTFDYPQVRILRDISFSVPKGAVVGLIGPNGAGKTTLLSCLAALQTPIAGEIKFADIDLSADPRRTHAMVGFLKDSFGLFVDLTVEQSLRYFCAAHKVVKPEWEDRIKECVELLEMSDFVVKKVGDLSLGQRQRVAIAQAIIHKPEILLLDEPATGLDPYARKILSKLIRKLSSEGLTLIVSSHILTELEEYSTHMLVLEKGQVIDFSALGETPEQDQSQEEIFYLEMEVLSEIDAVVALLKQETNVETVTVEGRSGKLLLSYKGGKSARASLLTSLIKQGVEIHCYKPMSESLQDRYLNRFSQMGE